MRPDPETLRGLGPAEERPSALAEGLRHYERGDWSAAGGCFATAVRASGNPQARLAADSAHACLAARAIGVELDRLVPAVHYRAAADGSGLYRGHGAPASAPVLIELRSLLAASPVPLPVVHGIYRNYPPLENALRELTSAGWLVRTGDAVRADPRCAALLADLRAAVDGAAEAVWRDVPVVSALVGPLDAVARAAVGTSPGPVFDALLEVTASDEPAALLLDRISALRHHRADCVSVAGGDAAPADRMAARPYRPLEPTARQGLLDALRSLPG